MKCCVIDNRIAYSGSANLTEAAEKDLEMTFRFTGQPVDDISEVLKFMLASERCREIV